MFRENRKRSLKVVDNNLAFRLDSLQKRIGYRFKDLSLLIHALMHKSAVTPEHDPTGLSSNERLELLGDSILDFLVAEELFNRTPRFTEGKITAIKSLAVSRKIIGKIADSINLNDALILGKCYENLKTSQTDVCSNAFEALIAAVYLDGGMKKARGVLREFLFPFIEQLSEEKENINYKTLILEYLQRNGIVPAKYTVISESGPDHRKTFTVSIEIDGKKMGVAKGNTKKDAEQKAAKIAADKFGIL